MATHSSVLAWRIPWTEKPGRLQSMGLHRVGHDWSDLAAYIYIYLYLYLSIYLYVYTHREYLLYPFIYWWTLGLLPYLCYCKEWCYEHWDKYIFSKWCFHFFPVIFPRAELLGHIVVLFLVFEHLHTVFPEKAMASHSRTLAWRIPWMEEPGTLQSMGLLRVDATERLHFHFSISHNGEGNGNPFQCSCLDNPRDGRAWWAAVYGVAQSRTWLKRLSSSSSILFSTVAAPIYISIHKVVGFPFLHFLANICYF